MVIERDKDYKIYVVAYVIASIVLLLLYIYGFNTSIGFAFLINIPVFLISILGSIAIGRTFIMDEEGCTVCFWKYRKKYAWEELKTRKIEEHHLPSMFRGRYSCPYLKEAIFAPHKIRKPKVIRAQLYSLFHPLSCVYINFSIGDVPYHGRYYEVDEVTFRQKMKEWGVDLEET